MYDAACKVEFQPFDWLYSQLTFFDFDEKKHEIVVMALLFDCWSLIGRRSSSWDDRVHSQNHNRFTFLSFFFSHSSFPASGQAGVTGVVPSLPPVLAFNFLSRIPGRVQQSHCSSIFHRVLLTHALALFPQVNLYTRKIPNEFIRVCTGRGSNSRNRPIPGSRIT